MPYQILPTPDLVGVAVGNDKEVVCNGGDGVVVVVGDNDAVVIGAFSNHGFNVLDVHGVNLRKGLVQNVERSVAVQHQIEFGQPGFATGEFIDGRIVMSGELGEAVEGSGSQRSSSSRHTGQMPGAVSFHPESACPAADT